MIRTRRRQPRRGPLRDQAYMDWLKERSCVVCFLFENLYLLAHGPQWGIKRIVDPAHTQNNGMRSKGPDSSCAPLCRPHHVEYDKGRKAFEAKYGVDMQNEAAAHWAAYQLSKETA